MVWIAVAAMMQGEAETWYGPVRFSFDLAVEGSPYDAEANDVRVEFISGGTKEERHAYFDGEKWHAVLLGKTKGAYTPTVIRNGKRLASYPTRISLQRRLEDGFVRIGSHKRSFRLGDGKPYFPLGHNLGWQDNRIPLKLTDQIAEMGKNGANWARIWACSWDQKNPYYSEGLPHPKGRDMHAPVLKKWDAIVEASEQADVRFQFVLFHHGSYSTRTDANWNIHAWNTANGGFLAKPEEFFTHPEAIARAKNWLRHAVARWGHSPSIMAWELFNEVEWVDAIVSNQAENVGKWHEEMAAYLRSIDPYKRLVTTSSRMELPIWRSMDYYQPHGYPPDIRALVLGTAPKTDKPLFYGEVGLGGGPRGAESERMAVRNGLWAGLMAGHAGAAQYWYWDRVVLDKLYPEFDRFSRFIQAHGLGTRNLGEPLKVQVESRQAGAVTFAPGQGWASTTQLEYRMPEDASSGALGKLSGFIQGPGKKDMMPEPPRFTFQSKEPGIFEVHVGTVARQGASLKLLVDGQVQVMEKFEPAEADRPLRKSFKVGFGPGKHTVTIANDGPDWFVADWFKIDGIGRAVTVNAAKFGDRVLLRLANMAGTTSEKYSLTLPGSRYRADTLDLETGKSSRTSKTVSNGCLKGEVSSKDMVLLLTPVR